MFTGIIESLGIVDDIIKKSNSSILRIKPQKQILTDVKIGDSICTNGVCLTVTNKTEFFFEADVMCETLNVTTLSTLSVGEYVNLERAMKISDRFGGHIVSGHIDGTGTISNIDKKENSTIFTIQTSQELLKYIILRGSVCIDGISLTVMKLANHQFQVSIIPHTLKETSLYYKTTDDVINLETDIIGKYIERFLLARNDKPTAITEEFLKEHGF